MMKIGTWTTEPPPPAVDAFITHLRAYVAGAEPPPDLDTPDALALGVGLRRLIELSDLGQMCFQAWHAEEQRGIRADGMLTAALSPGKAFMAAGVDIAEQAPALEKWRTAVLHDRKRQVLERVAAWELTALACDALGDVRHKHAALETARMLAARGVR